jgi:hypothetical protein
MRGQQFCALAVTLPAVFQLCMCAHRTTLTVRSTLPPWPRVVCLASNGLVQLTCCTATPSQPWRGQLLRSASLLRSCPEVLCAVVSVASQQGVSSRQRALAPVGEHLAHVQPYPGTLLPALHIATVTYMLYPGTFHVDSSVALQHAMLRRSRRCCSASSCLLLVLLLTSLPACCSGVGQLCCFALCETRQGSCDTTCLTWRQRADLKGH